MADRGAQHRAESADARRREVASQLVEVGHQLADLRVSRASIHDDDEHDPDGVSLSSEWSRLEGLRQGYEQAIAALEAAAARISTEGDGVCSSCGRPIGADRLSARPDATTCIECAA